MSANDFLWVDFDPRIWIEIRFDVEDAHAWAVDTARECWEETGETPSDEELTLLSTRLLLLQESLRELPRITLLHLVSPDPALPVGPLAQVTAVDASDGSDDSLRELVGATDPLCIEPPVLSLLDTPMGRALRCRRFAYEHPPGRLRHRSPPVFLAYSYVWHLPEHESDVRLMCTAGDIASAATYEADFDALARTISIVPADD